jgi:hypothetical protein
MKQEDKVRCVNITSGQVKYLVPAIANNPIRMKSIGYRVDELPENMPSFIKEETHSFEIPTEEEAPKAVAKKPAAKRKPAKKK